MNQFFNLFLEDADINNILVSNNIPSGEKNYRYYFILLYL